MAAVGRFLLYFDGSGGAKRVASEIESPERAQLAYGNDTLHNPFVFQYDNLPLYQL
jgi:hypothetical protein